MLHGLKCILHHTLSALFDIVNRFRRLNCRRSKKARDFLFLLYFDLVLQLVLHHDSVLIESIEDFMALRWPWLLKVRLACTWIFRHEWLKGWTTSHMGRSVSNTRIICRSIIWNWVIVLVSLWLFWNKLRLESYIRHFSLLLFHFGFRELIKSILLIFVEAWDQVLHFSLGDILLFSDLAVSINIHVRIINKDWA